MKMSTNQNVDLNPNMKPSNIGLSKKYGHKDGNQENESKTLEIGAFQRKDNYSKNLQNLIDSECC